jgi:hypothetical protein
MPHLRTACPFSRQVRYEILSWLQMTCRQTLIDWWTLPSKRHPSPFTKACLHCAADALGDLEAAQLVRLWW